MKKALITGITGQDGSYLAELLLSKGYEVHGVIRRASTFNTGRIDHIFKDIHEKDVKMFLHYGDLADSSNISRIIDKVEPDEIYNLGAQSHVRVSFDMPEYTGDVAGLGTLRILDAIKEIGIKTRFYQASCARFLKKSVYEKIDGFDESVTAGEDYDFQNKLNRGGYKTGFIDAEALHLGEPTDFWKHMMKYYEYGKDFVNYKKNNSDESKKQLSFFRGVYFKKWKKFLLNPVMAVIFLFYNCFKFGFGGVGYLKIKVKK